MSTIVVLLVASSSIASGCVARVASSDAAPTTSTVSVIAGAEPLGPESTDEFITTTTTAPPPAPPTTVSTPPARSSEPASVGTDRPPSPESLILVDIPATIPGWTIVWSDTSPGATAMTYAETRTIIMSNRDLGPDPARRARVLGHEIGHAIDFSRLDDAVRRQWMDLRALSGPWFGCWGCTDFGTPAGDWAEAVGHTVTGGLGPWRSQLGPPPDATAQVFVWSVLAN